MRWAVVTSGVPQGLVLDLLVFLIYANDLPNEIKSFLNIFADDANIKINVRRNRKCHILQTDLDSIHH